MILIYVLLEKLMDMQMFLNIMQRKCFYNAWTLWIYIKAKQKKGIAKKKATGWIPGNTVNLTTLAKSNASKARVEQANEYCREIIPVIREIQRYGKVTLQGIADALMARNIKTRRGKAEWTPMGVSNLLKKAEKLRI